MLAASPPLDFPLKEFWLAISDTTLPPNESRDAAMAIVANPNCGLEKKSCFADRISIPESIPINSQGSSPLLLAALASRHDVLVALIEMGADVKATNDNFGAIHAAAFRGNVASIECLISSGVDITSIASNGMTALHCAAHNDHVNAIRTLVSKGSSLTASDNSGCTALHVASYRSSKNAVEALIDLGADLNAEANDRYTPLHYAVRYSHIMAPISVLIERGALVEATDIHGNTPLHTACQDGSVVVADLLIDHGSNINLPNLYGYTPLHQAISHIKMLKALLAYGADINAADIRGSTLMHKAALNGDVAIIKLIADTGADMEAFDKEMSTPMAIAIKYNKIKVIPVLAMEGGLREVSNTPQPPPQSPMGIDLFS